ncbi:MAG: OmpH family outer membrane protein [Alphaproteobacteria bacterium]|nr:OmpH family outer membrane protein [Alphaproteobacteria bacterium]
MERRKIILFALLFIGCASVLVWSASRFYVPSFIFNSPPKELPIPLSIGVVDINKIKNDSRVFQKFRETLDSRNAKIYKEVLDRETTLRTEYEQFRNRAEEAKEQTLEIIKQKTELDKKYALLEKMVRSRREELDKEYSKGLSKIKAALTEIMDELGKIHGLQIILNKSIGEGNQMDQSIILYYKDGLDLTKEAIERLDKRVSLRHILDNED